MGTQMGWNSLYYNLLGMHKGLSVITLPDLNLNGWNSENKWGTTVGYHVENLGESSRRNGTKIVFLCQQCNAARLTIEPAWIWIILKPQPWTGVPVHTATKYFQISVQGIQARNSKLHYYYNHFTAVWILSREYPAEALPEETFTYSHIHYLFPPSAAIHGILPATLYYYSKSKVKV